MVVYVCNVQLVKYTKTNEDDIFLNGTGKISKSPEFTIVLKATIYNLSQQETEDQSTVTQPALRLPSPRAMLQLFHAHSCHYEITITRNAPKLLELTNLY